MVDKLVLIPAGRDVARVEDGMGAGASVGALGCAPGKEVRRASSDSSRRLENLVLGRGTSPDAGGDAWAKLLLDSVKRPAKRPIV